MTLPRPSSRIFSSPVFLFEFLIIGIISLFFLTSCDTKKPPVSDSSSSQSTELASTEPEKIALWIVDQGKSSFSIVLPELAPISVIAAAEEMQRDIEESTGVKLPILKDNVSTEGPFISLGTTQQSKDAGISAEELPEEGFRIVTKNGNLFILGQDTTTEDVSSRWWDQMVKDYVLEPHPEIPGPARTKNGGFSMGTANGVYTFLEDALGMRWLMPGELGRDVPQRESFGIPEMDRIEASPFTYRVMVIINSPEWRKHMKLGYSYRLNHTHAALVPDELFKDHPNWFAMGASGERLDPTKNQGKLETTQPELVQYVAEEAVQQLKEHPEWPTFSLSPKDGLGFSQSPESKALWDPAVNTLNGPSITPLMLKFYSDVAKIVEEKAPGRKLSGYLYSLFRYPPSDGNIYFEKNFVPVLTGSANSYKLYDPDALEKEIANIKAWSPFVPGDWFYYGYPSYISAGNGLVTPVGVPYLSPLFKTLKENGIKGFNYYGHNSWSQTSLPNYVAAKLLWNPDADAFAIQHDWLMRAYGPEAGAVMEEFYNQMDRVWFFDYYSQPNPAGSRAPEAFFGGIYGKYYPDMEKLILKAEAQPMTDIQKKRLRLISDNMRLLQWRIRQAGYLPKDYQSPYTLTTQEVFDLLSRSSKDAKDPLSLGSLPSPQPTEKIAHTQVAEISENSSSKKIPNSEQILIYSPLKDREIHIAMSQVQSGSSYLAYYIFSGDGKRVTYGLLDNHTTISFTAKADMPYFFQVVNGGVSQNTRIRWDLSVADAVAVKEVAYDGKTLTLKAPQDVEAPSILVYVPEKLDRNVENTPEGVSIRFQTTAQFKSKAMREASHMAKNALETALNAYQGLLVQNLDRGWKFTPDPERKGMQEDFEKVHFNDSAWKSVDAIGPWQIHGFDHYHGTAWYRKTFTASKETLNEPELMDKGQFLLFVGAVDGDATFYLNGQKIAERKISDHFDSWQTPFAIDISNTLIPGENVLAVEVTKNQQAAGLYKGVSIIAGKKDKQK